MRPPGAGRSCGALLVAVLIEPRSDRILLAVGSIEIEVPAHAITRELALRVDVIDGEKLAHLLAGDERRSWVRVGKTHGDHLK